MTRSTPSARHELATAPLGDFTARRDALATSLAEAGRRDEAAAVRRMRKPSAALWALNRLALDDRDAFSRLVSQAEELRKAERGAPSPEGARRAVALGRAFRESVQGLARRAAGVLVESGSPATAATRQRIHASLLGVATAARDELRALERGELDHELEPPDVSDVLALLPPARKGSLPRRVASARPPDVGRAREKARAPNDEARARAELRAHAEAQRAREEAHAAEQARSRAARARHAAEEAEAEAERALQRARAARQHAEAEEARAGGGRTRVVEGGGRAHAAAGDRHAARRKRSRPR